jgi:DNA-binding NarL/FixJ family response regulator
LFLRSGNGLEVLRAFGIRRADQHMLVLTNYATAEIRKKAIDAGADAVFDKSTEVDAFLELCRTYSTE